MEQNAFLQRPRRGRAVLIAAVLVLVLAGAVTAVVVALGSKPDSDTPGQSEVPETVAPTTDLAEAVPDEDIPEVLTLDTVGTELVEDMWVGFDHDFTGAVSAGVEYWSTYASNLDPDRGEALGAAIYSERMLTEFDADDLRAMAIDSRESIGAPTEGALPERTGLTVSFANYRTYGFDDDRVNLLLLGKATVYRADGAEESSPVLYPMVMVWEGGDWKIDGFPFAELDYESLLAEPGSVAATEKGWRHLNR